MESFALRISGQRLAFGFELGLFFTATTSQNLLKPLLLLALRQKSLRQIGFVFSN